MSANPHWEVVLARTQDMEPIATVPGAFTLTPIFNRPGTFSGRFRLDHKTAYKVAKHATCVVCQRNDSTRWSGPIVNVRRDPGEMSISITAVGWLDELFHRQVRPSEEASLSFANVRGGEIVQALINVANAQTATDGSVQPTHLRAGYAYDTQQRTRSYKRGQNYGQAIQELSDVENGLDLRVNYDTRELSTYPPTFYSDRTNVQFGMGVEPFNLKNAPQTDDGTTTAERVTVQTSSGLVVVADDTSTVAAHGGAMRESWLSISDVNDVTIAAAYANAQLVYSRRGVVTYDLELKPYADVPRLYDDYDLGDKVYLSIDAGALQVDKQATRIFSVTINVDSNGNETISNVTTSPQ